MSPTHACIGLPAQPVVVAYAGEASGGPSALFDGLFVPPLLFCAQLSTGGKLVLLDCAGSERKEDSDKHSAERSGGSRRRTRLFCLHVCCMYGSCGLLCSHGGYE